MLYLSRTTIRAGSSSTWPFRAGLCQPSFRRRAHIVGHRRAGNDPKFSRELEITCGASLLEAAPQCTEVLRSSASQPSQLLGGWLVQGVETVVKYLANSRQQSLLLLVHSGRRGQPVFSTQPLTNDQAAAANWPHVANQVLATGASALVLVRPILSPKAACPFTAGAADTDTSGSATNSPECSLYSDCQLTSHTQASSADLQGHVDVGGCCAQAATQPPPDLMQQAAQQLMRSGSSDSSDSSSSSEEEGKAPADLLGSTAPKMPRSRRRFQRRQQQAAAATSIMATYAQSTGSARSTPSHIVSHYGLVVQSLVEGHHSLQPQGLGQRALSSHDGCYVLKTTQNSVPGGCSCTLFSLTHVCWGQPLYQQLRNAWLAP